MTHWLQQSAVTVLWCAIILSSSVAEQEIVNPCTGGGANVFYPGDLVKIICFRAVDSVDVYRIQPSDYLRIVFPGNEEYNIEQAVKPDGAINLPRLTRVKVSGLSIDSANALITAAYRNISWNPEFFMVISQFDAKLREIQDLFSVNSDYRVNPDGKLMLPFIGEIEAGGRSVDALTKTIQSSYTILFPRLYFDLQPDPDKTNRVFVFGKVAVPGAYSLTHAHSILELLSLAGGVLNAASLRSVVVMNIQDNTVICTRVNVKQLLRTKKHVKDITLCPGTIVFVPQRPIYTAADFTTQLASVLFFRGFSTGLVWDTNEIFGR